MTFGRQTVRGARGFFVAGLSDAWGEEIQPANILDSVWSADHRSVIEGQARLPCTARSAHDGALWLQEYERACSGVDRVLHMVEPGGAPICTWGRATLSTAFRDRRNACYLLPAPSGSGARLFFFNFVFEIGWDVVLHPRFTA